MIEDLQTWYLDRCDGDWEHQYGISIETLDNPGWDLRIDLVGTGLEDRPLTLVSDTSSDVNWTSYSIKDGAFRAACGPQMLSIVIAEFLKWAKV